MNIYAIGDTHLSLNDNISKPMDKFGEIWENHVDKLKLTWEENVSEDDYILLVGDISWGMTLEEAREDLNFLSNLKGNKILIKGNHDFWWQSVSKVREAFKEMIFLQNDSFLIGNLGVCGTRGWLCPGSDAFRQHDEKIYIREANRLKASFDDAIRKGAKEIICMLHYPPTNQNYHPSLFTEVIDEYPVKKVIYGHLHGKEIYQNGLKGIRNGIEYSLASFDYLKGNLLKVCSL